MASHVKVIVPASTANLGPGFDCLGLALGLFNSVEMWASEPVTSDGWRVTGEAPRDPRHPTLSVEGDGRRVTGEAPRDPRPPTLSVEGEGAGQLPEDGSNLILRAAARLFEKAGRSMPALRVKATNGIPLASGMGSSAAAVVGGLVAANALLDGPLSRKEILRLAFEIEGHPDNAAPAIFGGLVIVSATGEELVTQTVDVPPLQVAIALPNVRLSTAEARAALPQSVTLGDAVFNIGRAALVVKALEHGDYELLRYAMVDRLHQPYRRRLISCYDEVVVAARKAGAAAIALSGAGPSLVAFAAEGHELIAKAMGAAIEKAGLAARTFVLPVDRQGVRVSVAG